MVKRSITPAILVAILIVVIVAMIAIFSEQLPFAQTAEFEFNLPLPAQLTDAGFDPITTPSGSNVIVATGINCKIKQTTIVVGVRNGQIVELARLESRGIQGSPFTTLQLSQSFTQAGEELSHFQVEPKIFCSEANGLPVQVNVRQLSVSTFGSGEGLLDRQSIVGSQLLNFGQGQVEQRIVQWIIPASDLDSQLPNQNFDIDYQFHVTGLLDVTYRDFPQIIYGVNILTGQLRTDYTASIMKEPTVIPPLDSDGDGIPDSVDQCDFQAETKNNFEDGDGCPDVKPPDVPPPTEVPTSCAEELEQFGVGGTLCQTACEQKGQQFNWVLLNGIGICLEQAEPTFNDADGDGVRDRDDVCANQQEDGIQASFIDGVREADRADGCPSNVATVCNGVLTGIILATTEDCITQPPPPIDATLQDRIINDGDLISVITVTFVDGAVETTLGSLKDGTFGTASFESSFGQIIPQQITGSITGNDRPIDNISYRVIFDLPNNNGISLLSSDLSHIVTVVESSVSRSSGGVVRLTGETLGSGNMFGFDLASFDGWVLGDGIVTSAEINTIAQSIIPEGQQRDADVSIEYDGTFSFSDNRSTENFVLSNSRIQFQDVLISISGFDLPPINCEELGLLPVKDEFGDVVACKQPDPADSDIQNCGTSERSSFLCDSDYRDENCNGTTVCTEPDDDGDGVPNYRDSCIAEFGNQSNGCPEGFTPPPPPPTIVCPIGQICTPEPPTTITDTLCSESNPDACIVPPQDTLTIIIIGAIIVIIIGVGVAVARRR